MQLLWRNSDKKLYVLNFCPKLLFFEKAWDEWNKSEKKNTFSGSSVCGSRAKWKKFQWIDFRLQQWVKSIFEIELLIDSEMKVKSLFLLLLLLLLLFSEKPHNPMINAGAIMTCSLLKTLVKPEMTLAEKFDYTLAYFKVFFQ